MRFYIPPIYRSEVGIIVEEQQIPENYVQSTITGYVEERIEMITQQVMSRSKLLEIINKHNLYWNLKEDKTESELISIMRNNIVLKTMTAEIGKRNAVTIGFKLSYSGRNPEKLQAVANELAYLYLEEEHRTKEKQASMTTDFLKQELNNFKQHITYLEKKISDFKKEHIGQLPENYASNLRILTSLEGDLDRIEPNIRSLEERKLYLKTQLAAIDPMKPIVIDGQNVMMSPVERLKRLRLQLASLKGTYSEKHPDIKKLKAEIQELESQIGKQHDTSANVRRLKDLEGKIASMSGRLGANHPDVVQLSKEYEALSKEITNLEVARSVSNIEQTQPDNPVYINLMTQIATIDSQIKGLVEEKRKIEKELEKYQRLIENAPTVEKEYNELTRDHGMAMQKYNDLLGKLMQAQVAQGMEASQHGERFTISEPASYPDKPYKPNRKIIIFLGILFGISAGIGLIAVQEVLDESLKSTEEIAAITGLPVFSSFPLIQTDEELKENRKKKIIYLIIFLGMVITTVILFHYTVMPLDVLWAKVINRLIIIGVPIEDLINGK